MTKFHLPSLPGKFEQAALALPAQIDAILATFDDNEDASGVVDVIDYVEAREHVARRIKADTPVVNALVHCRLKSMALWAKLTPRQSAGRAERIGSGGEPILFAKATTAKYRKVGDNVARITEYAEASAAEDVEMSPTAFLKWLKGDSGEKLAEKKAEIEAEIEAAIKHTPTATQADAIEWLEAADDFDLLLTDPPYSTDVDDINAFAESWLPLALSKMKPTGRAFVCVGAYPAELLAYLSVAMPAQVLVWTYRNTLGPSPKDNYKLNWQAILYYKGPEAGPLDCPVMLEQFSVQDINAPDGRQADRYHAWQKPLELGERFIRHATAVGDTVVDPFCCTGTFLLAAGKLGRVGTGCDLSAEHLAIAEQRGCKIV